MHSEKYDMVRKFFKTKMWNETQLRNAVLKNWITASEFQEIAGKEY